MSEWSECVRKNVNQPFVGKRNGISVNETCPTVLGSKVVDKRVPYGFSELFLNG